MPEILVTICISAIILVGIIVVVKWKRMPDDVLDVDLSDKVAEQAKSHMASIEVSNTNDTPVTAVPGGIVLDAGGTLPDESSSRHETIAGDDVIVESHPVKKAPKVPKSKKPTRKTTRRKAK